MIKSLIFTKKETGLDDMSIRTCKLELKSDSL